MHRRAHLLVPFLAVAVALAACEGDDPDPASTDDGPTPTNTGTTEPAAAGVTECPADSAGANMLNVSASRSPSPWRFVPDPLEAAGGELTIQFENAAQNLAAHSLIVEGTDIGMFANPGDTCSKSVTLEAGTYTVYCDVSGHREEGMETTLTVT